MQRDVIYTAGNGAAALAIGDLDCDLDLDLAMVNEYRDEVSVLLNDCILIGNVNLDGEVNLLVVQPFVVPLQNSGYQDEADINQDGALNLLDGGTHLQKKMFFLTHYGRVADGN